MSGWIRRWNYYLRDAVESVRYSPAVTVLALGTLTAVLAVSGVLLLVMSNLGSRLETARDQVRVDVYLKDGVEPAAREAVRSALAGTPGVSRVVYIDKERALALFEEYFGNTDSPIGELPDNPLPASFEVFLDKAEQASALASKLSDALGSMEGVEEVRYDRRWLDRLDALLTLARAGGLAGGLTILVVVVFVMASMLRLAVFARRDEIEIMLLVGATPGFVRGPFLAAGLALGLVGSCIALGVVELVRQWALATGGETAGALIALLAGTPLDVPRSVALAAAGGLVSLIASFVAVRQDTGARQL